jgi:hypothetical protein
MVDLLDARRPRSEEREIGNRANVQGHANRDLLEQTAVFWQRTGRRECGTRCSRYEIRRRGSTETEALTRPPSTITDFE